MINVVQNNEIYEITFPYDINIVYLVKSIPGRRWVPDAKMWTIPKDKLGFLINQFKGTRFEPAVNIISDEHLNENNTLDKTVEIPDIDISKIHMYTKPGSTPYQHQLDFMKWALDRQQNGNMSGFLLADEMGLGKTVEVMNLALYNHEHSNFKHCLIICCINSSKYNWLNDIQLHTDNKYIPYILGTRLKKDKSVRSDTGSKEKLEDLKNWTKYGVADGEPLPYFLILNIEALRYKDNKSYQITDEIISHVKSGDINMIALDEIHKNASVSSIQGKQILQIKKATGMQAMWVPMTGTPITKEPVDVFLPLKLCDSHSFNSYYKWCQEFCVYGGFGGYEVIGYKNIDKLKRMLQPNMLRRLKDDVLDLPPKIHYTEYIENTPYQNRLYKDIVNELLSSKDDIMRALNPMAKFLRLRQVNGSPELIDDTLHIDDPSYLKKNAKLVRLLELLDDADARGEKTVVFSNWVEPLRTLYTFISKKYKTCVFTGTMSAEDREKHKQAFMTIPEYKVLLGTIGAAGASHTFTAARNIIFYDSPWNPSDKDQAEDRCYRIGTNQSVNIYTLVSKDTVDDRVEQILSTKSGVAKYIVDGKLDLRHNAELVELLLGHE